MLGFFEKDFVFKLKTDLIVVYKYTHAVATVTGHFVPTLQTLRVRHFVPGTKHLVPRLKTLGAEQKTRSANAKTIRARQIVRQDQTTW